MNVIQWQLNTCSRQTNITTSNMTQVTRLFNVEGTMTYSSSGWCGGPRYVSGLFLYENKSSRNELQFLIHMTYCNRFIIQGTTGLGEQMDRMMQLTRYQVEKMKQENDRFYLLDDDPQCVNVCFWYIPERLRKSEHTKQKEIELGVVRIPSSWMSLQRKFPATNLCRI